MSAFLWRHRFKVTIAALVLIVTAGLLYLTDHHAVALPILVLALLLQVTQTIVERRHEPEPLPDLTEAEAEALRYQRDAVSEVAAIKMLRKAHPEVSLKDAVLMVRDLHP